MVSALTCGPNSTSGDENILEYTLIRIDGLESFFAESHSAVTFEWRTITQSESRGGIIVNQGTSPVADDKLL